MKYLSMPATLLMFSAMAGTSVYASEPNNLIHHVSETTTSPQTGKTMDEVLKQLAIKYNKQISALGLSTEQLNTVVYVRPDWIREPIPFATVKEFAAVLLALPNLESLKVVKEEEYLGFKMKRQGHASDGYALYQQQSKKEQKSGQEQKPEQYYLLKGIVDDEGLLETTDSREEELLFQLFRDKAMTVLTENGFKG